jgi:phospholipid/cholesterol/gamma-HCH transport system substrate-binding protein
MTMNNTKMGLISGVIVFVGLVVFFGGILWLSGNQFLSSKDIRIYIDFIDAAGLQDQAPVQMRGFRIGWTKDVEFREKFIRVAVDIRKKYPVPVDSRAEINLLNFMGEKAVTIIPGTSDTYLVDGGILKGENRDIMALAKNILADAKEKIEEGSLDEAITKVKETVENLRSLVTGMDSKVKSIDIDSINSQVAAVGEAGRSLKAFLATAEEKTIEFTSSSRESMAKLDQTMERLNEVFSEVSALSSDLQSVARDIRYGGGTASELINNKEFYVNLNNAIAEIKALIEDVKKHPKKYVKFSLF